jgi:hypothetical protein
VRYEEPPHLDHTAASLILEAALQGEMPQEPKEQEPNSVLVGLALFDDDAGFVEAWCLRVGREAPDLWLRGTAALCIGTHLARRFGRASPDAEQLVRDLAENDAVRCVNPQVGDALEDLEHFQTKRRLPTPEDPDAPGSS